MKENNHLLFPGHLISRKADRTNESFCSFIIPPHFSQMDYDSHWDLSAFHSKKKKYKRIKTVVHKPNSFFFFFFCMIYSLCWKLTWVFKPSDAFLHLHPLYGKHLIPDHTVVSSHDAGSGAAIAMAGKWQIMLYTLIGRLHQKKKQIKAPLLEKLR